MSSLLDHYRRVCLEANSYTRMRAVLDARNDKSLAVRDWYQLLGEYWSMCDNISHHKFELQYYLEWAFDDWESRSRRALLNRMMTARERAIWRSLPHNVTVYRGCYEINRDGLSWTLDRDIAERLPTLNRYRREGEFPLLLIGVVDKSRIVFKNDRKEKEVIAVGVEIRDQVVLDLCVVDNLTRNLCKPSGPSV